VIFVIGSEELIQGLKNEIDVYYIDKNYHFNQFVNSGL
jgi:hypothetical protein